jgi:hypothetical protein
MKCAVLCNGPSRVDFQSREGYTYVIGCNIPWFDGVDATVVLDEAIIEKWIKDPDLIKVPAYFSRKAWAWTDVGNRRDFFRLYLIELIDILPDFDSSGHNAVKCMIRKGFKEIDIYGCDSWFEQTIVSYTHSYIKNLNPPDDPKRVKGWRGRWNEIMEANPDVKLNFINHRLAK